MSRPIVPHAPADRGSGRPSSSAFRSGQKGAALIVVLLLAATLSFVALAISERTVLAAQRAVHARARAEALWRAFGAEALAAAALAAAARETPERMTLDEPWIERPIEVPMEGGRAVIWFADAGRCFNLNGLVRADGDQLYVAREGAGEELAALLDAAGAGAGEAARLAVLVQDWIDADSLSAPQGAEDGYYLGLPVPYRTGGTLLADETEMRALADMTPEFYAFVRRYACALPTPEPSPLNVNMLRAEDAPLLVGLLKGAISLAAAQDVVADRPPGGYGAVDEFWSHRAFEDVDATQDVRNRVAITSRYIAARAEIEYEGVAREARMLFEIGEGGRVRLLRRRLGPDA
ncbi:type II secretion system minor pseudopilin GspK [Amphiplicatus metriothermophilus]|uniref:Type II secretion system protein K n=1 Tax=Amphiplicatus metriothermophilus TaxID=1519374 RepID=A0A239PP59_9PROT|nr:type II secretion system minor pseudopilin GspK [Amphiplicatus metriothermophilus]MBB5518754.1 general secretion pathway protein K [Amphiplicatus metriothermophilus]SNT72091.1 type II secretion system protein K (GspK) [Amphiplicatus metriothermophilus]